jgi:hypothetical protein
MVWDSGSATLEAAIIGPKAEPSQKEVEDKAEENEGASLISPTLIKTSVTELSSPPVAITGRV